MEALPEAAGPLGPAEPIWLARSRWRSFTSALAGFLWCAGTLLGAISGVVVTVSEHSLIAAGVGLLCGVFFAFLLPAALQIVRVVDNRPQIWLESDDLPIWDPVLSREAERIRRADIAGARVLDWRREKDFVDYRIVELSPFRERLNVEIRLRRPVSFTSARSSSSGSWVWHYGRHWNTRPLLPEPGRLFTIVWLRAQDPEQAVQAITDWCA